MNSWLGLGWVVLVCVGLSWVGMRWGRSAYCRASTVSTACAPIASDTHMSGRIWPRHRSFDFHTQQHPCNNRMTTPDVDSIDGSWVWARTADFLLPILVVIEVHVTSMSLVLIEAVRFLRGSIFLPGKKNQTICKRVIRSILDYSIKCTIQASFFFHFFFCLCACFIGWK